MLLLAPVLGSGCGRSEFVAVRGRVTLDGNPVADYTVNFIASGTTKGSGALGSTDAEGRFTLRDIRGEMGIRAGEYKISFYPSQSGKSDNPADVVAPPRRGLVHPNYYDGNKSPLRATIPEEGATIDIVLVKSGDGGSVKVTPGKPADER